MCSLRIHQTLFLYESLVFGKSERTKVVTKNLSGGGQFPLVSPCFSNENLVFSTQTPPKGLRIENFRIQNTFRKEGEKHRKKGF